MCRWLREKEGRLNSVEFEIARSWGEVQIRIFREKWAWKINFSCLRILSESKLRSCNQATVKGISQFKKRFSWNFTLGTNNSIEHPDFPLKPNGSVIPETHFSHSRLAKKRILMIVFGILKIKKLLFCKSGFCEKKICVTRRTHTWQFKSILVTQTPKSFLSRSALHFFLPQFHEIFSLEWRESFSLPLTCGNSTPSSFPPASVAAHR